MVVVLALMSDSPYKVAVASFAEHFADTLGGRLRVATITGRPSEKESAPQTTAGNTPMERAEAEAREQVSRADSGPPTPVEVRVLQAPTVQECVHELARCDIGIVGKTLHGELEGDRGLGRGVELLKMAVTKPLVIVPEGVRPLDRAPFVHTDHPEAGHALELAVPLHGAGVKVHLFSTISPLGRTELAGTGSAYLAQHEVAFIPSEVDCAYCRAEGGPVAEVLSAAAEHAVDLIVMGGTHRGFLGRLLWPEMAHDVAWNAHVPVLIWY